MMEEGLFQKNHRVRHALFNGFVELRVHTDIGDAAKKKTNLDLQAKLAETTALPTFVIVDSATGEALRRASGVMGEKEFLEFLIPAEPK